MEQGRLHSLHHRIRTASSADTMRAIVAECIADREKWPSELVAALRDKIPFSSIDGEHLVGLILKERDRDLYRAAKPHLIHNREVLRDLIGKVPDPEIEERICDHLSHYRDTIDFCDLVASLGDHGSRACLATLEMLEFDSSAESARVAASKTDVESDDEGHPSDEKIRQMIVAGQSAPQTAVRAKRKQAVVDALKKLRQTDRSPPSDWGEERSSQLQFAGADKHAIHARDCLDRGDVESALVALRKATEAVLKVMVCSGKYPLPNDWDMDKFSKSTLEPLIQQSSRVLPRSSGVPNLARSIQSLTSEAAHDQPERYEPISSNGAESVLTIWGELRKRAWKELSSKDGLT
jgi:hypothetical protein